ncbi:response regulator [Desulfohalovibrio reitneri]|uniref:response regulator n=1 Tax=Desulfohalovibrio reitneri TaxID=1307759 RepID=UPI001376AEE3|nr:response regulator [Desulfohalovibrio reitneri]
MPQLGTVLVVSENEARARLDRSMLKNLGAEEVNSFESGGQVLRHLEKNEADLVLCDRVLSDMPGTELINRLRDVHHNLPVIMVSDKNHRNHVLDAVSSGCFGFLVRPYSQDALSQQINRAQRNARLPTAAAMMLAKARAMRRESTRQAERTVTSYARAHPARDHLEQGLDHLAAANYDQAVTSFKTALSLNRAYAEAYEGLARAWKAKGDKNAFLRLMSKAAWLYAEQDRFMEVKAIFGEVLKDGGSIENPFFELGKQLWKKELYRQAVLAWRRAVKLTPTCQKTVTCLAKAYIIMGYEDRAEDLLQRHQLPQPVTVEQLAQALEASRQPRKPSWLDHIRRAFKKLRVA